MQAMEISKTNVGEDHPDTLRSIGHLAGTYLNQGRWEEAEQLGLQLMTTCKTKLGEDHRDTLAIMANLAGTYFYQERWDQAEQLFLHVVEKRKVKIWRGSSRHADEYGRPSSDVWSARPF
jgi:hypothetical protein